MTAFDDGLWTRLVDEQDADRVILRAVPEQHGARARTVGLSGIGALAAAGVAAAVMLLGGGAGNAFAGWTSHPGRATAGELAAADAYCTANVPFAGLPLRLSEQRGPFTAEVFADATRNDFCMVGPSFDNASGFRASSPVEVPSGQLLIWADHTFSDAGQPYGTVIARAADDVSAAVLTLADGTQVTATVQNGWAVAWWPGSEQLTSAELTTPSGTRTQAFTGCELHNCGGPHGGSTAGGPGGG